MNRCKKCKNKLRKEWKYCPHCGESVRFKLKIPNFFSAKHVEDDMEDFERDIEKMFSAFGFPSVKFNVKTYRSDGNRILENKRHFKPEIKTSNKKEIIRKISERKEPKTEVKTMPNKTIISVSLPDVSSTKDIILNKFEESLEIRAYSGKKLYFKVVPVKKDSKIVKKTFKNKKLEIILS